MGWMSALGIVAAPFTGGASLALTAADQAARASARSAERQQGQNIQSQEDFAKHGIQWKVADAKAAGLHPLYALGANTASFAPNPVVPDDGGYGAAGQALSQMGQNVQRAQLATATPLQRMAQEMGLRVMQGQLNESDARVRLIDAQIAQLRQGNAGGGVPSAASINPDFLAGPQNPDNVRRGIGVVQVKPSEVTSYAQGDRSLAAGRDLLWKEFVYRDDKGKSRTITLPNAPSISEALEAVSESLPMQMTVINENIRRNPNFMSEARGTIPFAGAYHDISEFLWELRRLWSYGPSSAPKPVRPPKPNQLK